MKACLAVLLALLFVLTNCGSNAHPNPSPDCGSATLLLSPTAGTADHIANGPGNSVQFNAVEPAPAIATGNGCAAPQSQRLVTDDATWSVSDSENVTISNTAGSKGLASCMNRTNGGVTVTATAPSIDGAQVLKSTATLTCN